MVAYGVPVIHQSLATAPLDIKEAIDWLIRIGGKDLGKKGTDKTRELLKVAECCFQQECNALVPVTAIDGMKQALPLLANELATFIGYDRSGRGLKAISGFGVGRRSSLAILQDVSIGDFLLCCKDEGACTSQCKCCQNGNVDGGAKCNPNNCPIKKVLECSITLIGMCGEKGESPPNGSSLDCNLCCILSFLTICFKENETLDHSSITCKRCNNGNQLHKNCHRQGGNKDSNTCVCSHTNVSSKVACRINCLIQLATTLNTSYINKDVHMCNVCRNCKACGETCQPCQQCRTALQGKGQHCEKCRGGECCAVGDKRNQQCQAECQNCQTCSVVRNSKRLWFDLSRLLDCCAKCGQCNKLETAEHIADCQECKNCKGDSCDVGCRNRKKFGNLLLELLHFMAYNLADLAYSLPGRIRAIKEGCCRSVRQSWKCSCTETCCVDQQSGSPCVCNNKCSEKLELLLRPALSGYVSAYDYNSATWEALCKKEKQENTCSDECNAECQCYSATCPEEGCCAHCPKRKCAKILCMTMPAIYRFFDYINHQINSELQNTQGTTDSKWASALIDGDMHLGELFRTCGFQSNRLKPRMGCDLMLADHKGTKASCQLRDHKPGNLKKLLEPLERCNAIICDALHVSSVLSAMTLQCRKPETVREKLLWLCGLPYSDVYEDLQKAFVASMPNGSSSQHLMELTLSLGVFPFHIFEDSSDSVWEYITQGFNVPTGKCNLDYNADPTRLLWDVYDALYDVTCALTFVSKQCSVSGISNGWEHCKFGGNLSVYEGKSNGRCDCQEERCKASCDHCTTVCESCRPGAKCVCCCPHCEHRPDSCICLMRFIASNATLGDHSSSFRNDRYGLMGYRKEFLREVQMTGAALYDTMSGFFTDDHALFSKLLESLLIARAGAPNNLSDFYALFLGLGTRLQKESKQNGGKHKALAAEFKSSMCDTYFGAHEGIMEPVIAAVRKFYKEDSGHTSNGSAITDTSLHITSDLMSLYGCYSGVGCVGYMYALSSGPYEQFSKGPDTMFAESAGLFIKWVFCGATSLYNSMRHLRAEVHMLECCSTPANCTCNTINSNICNCKECDCYCKLVGSHSSCGTIVKCSKVHPLLYRFGFTFHEPDMWSSQKRKCKDFSDALNRFVGPESMLCRLMEAIENFLWHIRMPFCIAFLTLWSTAFCFLMYVFIGYLDRLGMRSRWLIPKQLAHPLQLVTRTMLKPLPGNNLML
ncbi:variant erythrocyte surface antigen [Babesia gibsoni]|uniref:Variant erythrocyte surface antigen n=1 Tax=Babesia gibsoni TaxID=33632 RepID=A0AAD8LPF4_BABGI|nr:variant erythrocyte surface antigen [Babesia gibsoni]